MRVRAVGVRFRTLQTTPRRSRAAWCVAALLSTAGAALAQNSAPEPDDGLVGSLPASTDFVVSVSNFREVRRTPAARALERFLGEMSTWEKSLAAWRDVATSIGLDPAQAADELGGTQIVFCIEGLSDSSRDRQPQHALIGCVSAETEERLREKLQPAPRGVDRSQPILALEKGAFKLSSVLPEGAPPGASARLLISPTASSRYFDRVLPSAAGKPAGEVLSGTPRWAAFTSLPAGPIALLFRDLDAPRDAEGGGEQFFALSATVADDTVGASFVASQGMLLRQGGASAGRRPWPAPAAAMLEHDATLFIAGSPREQPAGSAPGSASKAPGTLLLSLMSSLRLPRELEAKIDGVALIAVHRTPAGLGLPALSITGAIPVANLAEFRAMADRWVLSLAGDPGRALPEPAPGTAPVLILGDEGSPILGGFVHAGGCLAWSYAPAPEGPGGWWVLNIRTTPGDESRAASAAIELCARLGQPPDQADRTVYRLVIRPAGLAEVLAANAPAAPEGKLSSFRWIERVETRVRSRDDGLIDGTIALRMNASLLEP